MQKIHKQKKQKQNTEKKISNSLHIWAVDENWVEQGGIFEVLNFFLGFFGGFFAGIGGF